VQRNISYCAHFFLSLHVLKPLWQFHRASLCWIETGLWLFPLFYGVLLAEQASGNYCNIGICISLVVQCFIGVSILLSSCGVYWIGLFVCLPWILPTSKLDEVILWGSKGWSESPIHPYKPDLLYETRRYCLEFTQVSLCGDHFMHSGYRQYEHQVMDSLHINLLIWGVSLLKIWHCLSSSLLS
jgi:hypothetical protein